RLTGVRHWIDAIHNRPELSLAQPSHNLRVFRRVAHRGSEQAPVMPEQAPQIEAHLRPGRRTTGHQSSPASETAQRVVPRRGADILDHDVHAALVGERAYLLRD